jgi:hypothetical protein
VANKDMKALMNHMDQAHLAKHLRELKDNITPPSSAITGFGLACCYIVRVRFEQTETKLLWLA